MCLKAEGSAVIAVVLLTLMGAALLTGLVSSSWAQGPVMLETNDTETPVILPDSTNLATSHTSWPEMLDPFTKLTKYGSRTPNRLMPDQIVDVRERLFAPLVPPEKEPPHDCGYCGETLSDPRFVLNNRRGQELPYKLPEPWYLVK